jgi:hypothetical protein
MRWPVCAAMLLLWLAGLSARAEDANPIFDLYRMGNYEGAIAAGQAANTGEGLAIAARAAFAEANLSDSPCMPCLKRVEGLARRSIMLDANRPDAFVYLAAAIGYEARIIGYLNATVARYPEQAKQVLERALAAAPNDAWSLAAMGAWHIEIVRNGGSFLARTVYGARADAGEEFFRRAFTADPNNLVIRLQYVLAMSAYDLNRNREKMAEQLMAAATLQPRTAYETVMKARAARLLELLKANRRAEYLALINRYQGYPQ